MILEKPGKPSASSRLWRESGVNTTRIKLILLLVLCFISVTTAFLSIFYCRCDVAALRTGLALLLLQGALDCNRS